MVSLSSLARPFAVIAVALSLSACTMTVNAVNPHPNVVVAGSMGALTVDTSRVANDQEMERVEIHEFRKSLENGFKNAVGGKFVAPGSPNAVRLVIESVTLELSNLGNIGRFVTLRYRAKWLAPDGELIAEVAGAAQPRNPTETGERHLEDVIEVMYERIIDGFDQTTSRRAPRAALR